MLKIIKTQKLLDFDLYSERKALELSNKKRDKLFPKYFPKYLKKFTLTSRKCPFISSKIKKAKIIYDFDDSQISWSFKKFKLLLCNQKKNIKSICNQNLDYIQFLQRIKLFSYSSHIRVLLPLNSDLCEEKYLKKLCRGLRKLKNLRFLEINELSKNHEKFIQSLNSSTRVLNSLKKVRIHCKQEAACNSGFLEILPEHKNFLKHITSIHLHTLCSNSHFRIYKDLASSCPKLKSLSFEFSNRSVFYNLIRLKRFSDQCFLVNINYLESLKNFQNLKSLSLDIADVMTFLKDCVVPVSVQYLKLNFEECLSRSIMSRIDKNFDKKRRGKFEVPQRIFEENKTLGRFYQRFLEIENLETFEIFFPVDSDQESYEYQNYLLHSLLKRIHSLEKLTSMLSSSPRWQLNKIAERNIRDTCLPEFFEACCNFIQNLQNLEIGHKLIIFCKFDLSKMRNKFPNLSMIKVTGRIGEDLDSDKNICLFLRKVFSLGSSITSIELNIFVDKCEGIGFLLSLLKQINQLDRPEKLLKLALSIYLCDGILNSVDSEINKLKEILMEYSKAKGVFLKLFTNDSFEQIEDFLKIYMEKFEKFGFIQIQDYHYS